MLTVLFWNVNGQRREALCANLVRRHAVDILVLAECPSEMAVRRELNRRTTDQVFRWHRTLNPCRVTVLSRFPGLDFREVESSQRYAVHALTTAAISELLVVSVHATSALLVKPLSQDEELRALAGRIAQIEDDRGHTRTLLVGDLNADPFDRRVQSAIGLHAEKSRPIAERRSRKVQGVDFRFFYNPMWQFLGKQHPEPQGTYYRRKAEYDTRFWHVFDQFLLRPDLMSHFADSDVSVLLGDGVTSFQKGDGTPNRKVASDHFPILLKFDYPGV